jgi:hypothetical protein
MSSWQVLAASVLCHEDLPLRQKGLPFGLTETQTAGGTTAGSASQAAMKGLHDTMPTPSGSLLAPKNPALSQRFAEIVSKDCREEQQKLFFAPIFATKTFLSPSVFAAKVYGKIATHGKSSGNALAQCRRRSTLAACQEIPDSIGFSGKT